MATTAARAAATAAAEFELAGETACGAYCPLAHPSDPSMLSPHLCHIRMHIELFAASPQDVERRRRQGGSKIVLGLGQVGIRCRWCKDLAGVPLRTKKARGATLFPNHLSNVHQAVRNFQRHHFLHCELIPSEVISVFENLRTGRCGGGKETQSRKQSSEYWVKCCMEMGLVDKMGGGVYFQNRGVPIRGRSPLVPGANATVGPGPVAGSRKRPHKNISASPGAPEGATVARSAQWTRRVRQPRRTTAAPPTPLAEKVQAIGGPAGGSLPPPQQCQPQDADSSARNGAIPVTPYGPLGSPRELERIDPRTTPRIGWMGGVGPFFSGGAGTGLGVPTAFGGVGSLTKTGAFATGYNNSKSALETIIHNFFFGPGTIDAPASVEEMQLREMKLTIIRSISSDECAAMVRAFVACKEDNLRAEFGDERLRMFLRREQFDPVNAALRFARYWQKRRELFGANKFALSMTPEAALRDDHKALLVGYIVILPGTDSKGRTLLLKGGNNKRGGDYEFESMARVVFYMLDVAMRLPSSQNGVVFLTWAKFQTALTWDRRMDELTVDLEAKYLPFEFTEIHSLAVARWLLMMLGPVLLSFMNPRIRAKWFVHKEWIDGPASSYLSKIGIKPDTVPTFLGGTLDFMPTHKTWLRSKGWSK